MQSYQMLSSHFADAHHADGISWHRYTVDGRLHESTGARGRSLTRLRGHRVMRLQQRLIIKSTAHQSLIRLSIIPVWFDRFTVCSCVPGSAAGWVCVTALRRCCCGVWRGSALSGYPAPAPHYCPSQPPVVSPPDSLHSRGSVRI